MTPSLFREVFKDAFKISPIEPLPNIVNPGKVFILFHICNSKSKAGITIKIRTNFIEHPDTESAEIKFYVVGYSTGPVVSICGGSFHMT